MARTTIVKILDDLDGSEAAETVQFGLDGVLHEIDLSEGNAKELRGILSPYIEAGRQQAGGARVRMQSSGTTVLQRRKESQAIREWARGQGKGVAERGRIPQEIVDEYRRAA
jgi:hypothetical protein